MAWAITPSRNSLFSPHGPSTTARRISHDTYFFERLIFPSVTPSPCWNKFRYPILSLKFNAGLTATPGCRDEPSRTQSSASGNSQYSQKGGKIKWKIRGRWCSNLTRSRPHHHHTTSSTKWKIHLENKTEEKINIRAGSSFVSCRGGRTTIKSPGDQFGVVFFS